MLDRIILYSIKNKLIVGLMVLALVLWGIFSLKELPIDAVPDITNNQVQILTVSPSNGAEDIERFVTFPVEQAMATIPDIEEIRSFSRFGLSVVTIVFKEKTDIYWARQQVSERLTEAKSAIPAGMGEPTLAPVTTGLGEIYQYIIYAKKGYENRYDATELRTIQDWVVRRQLLGVEGVADVSSFGGNLKQYEISLNHDQLRSMNVSIQEIFDALKKNNQNTGGAYIEKTPNAYFIKSEGLVKSIEDIQNIVVKIQNGIPVLIRNVAEVNIGAAIRYGAMTRNAEGEVVGAIVMMLKGANSSRVIANVKERIAQIEKNLPEGVVIEAFLDRTKLVNNAIETITKNLIEGALIVIFVLVLLLGNIRAGLIVASVIPLSMLFAISLMNLFGVSGNLMSLGAIDFGLIVDGAVIIVEAIVASPLTPKGGISIEEEQNDNNSNRVLTLGVRATDTSGLFATISKIRTSATFGEIIILIVYLPIWALVGVEGKMFRPMAQTVSFAILGAFLLSITYIPMMSALFLNKKIEHKPTIADRIIAFFQRFYRPAINFALRSKRLIVGISAALLATSLLIFNFLGAEFVPTLEEGDFAVDTRVLTGSNIQQTIQADLNGAKVLIENFPEVKMVVGKIGSSEIPIDPMAVEASDMMVILKDRDEWTSAESRDELAEKMQKKLEETIPGVTFGFQQPIQMRFNELMTGVRQDVAVKIYGEDLEKLTFYAKKIGEIAGKIKGATDIYVEQVSGLPQIVVTFHRDKIAQFGLNIEDINTSIRAGFAGEKAGLVFEGEKRFDLVVRLNKTNRQSIEDIQNLTITAPNGNQIPLNQVADVSFKIGPSQIQRDEAKRRIVVGFNVRGRDVESIVEELQEKVNTQIKFETGYFATYGGTFKNLQEARERLAVAVPIALLLIFVLLYLTFKSIKQAIMIFTAIPFSAIGGILFLWLRDMPFSISAGVGFIALFGVSVLNGIVLIAEFNRLKKEGITDLTEIVKKGTSTRLRPVLMTALVASLGFLPMALSGGSGGEVQKPLATVVIGGLISATLLTLLVLPIFYIWFEKINVNIQKTSISAMILIGLMGFSTNISAQKNSLKLNEAIEIALKNNRTITASNLEIDYQKAYKKSLNELPKTSISTTLGQYNSKRFDNQFNVSQGFYLPKVFRAKDALGESLIKSSELKRNISKNDLIFQVRQTYLTLQYLYEYEQLLIQQDSIFRDFLKLANLRYKTGESSILEKINAETQVSEIQNKIKQNQSDILGILAQFKAILLVNENIEIDDKNLSELTFILDESAIQNNPNLAFLQQQIVVSEQQKSVEKARLLPEFNVGYLNQSLIGVQNLDNQDVFFGVGHRFQAIQLGMNIPIFKKAFQAKINSAEIEKQIAENNQKSFENQLKGQFEQLKQELLKYKTSLEYFRSSALPNANLILKTTQTALQKGELSYTEYLFNLKNINATKEQYLQTLWECNQTIQELNYLIGQ